MNRLLALGLVALAGCARAPQRPMAPPGVEPATLLATAHQREEQVRTLRARFRSTTSGPGGTNSANGVLLVDKPERFRLRLMLPFGLTVFDYLAVGDRTWIVLPLAGDEQRARAAEQMPFSRDDLAQAFLRGRAAFPGHCEASRAADSGALVMCRDSTTLRRTLLLAADATIVEETGYEDGVPRLVLRYTDYRPIDGIPLPFHITLDYPQRQQSVAIAIDKYEVNPLLGDTLFTPLEGAAPSAPGAGR